MKKPVKVVASKVFVSSLAAMALISCGTGSQVSESKVTNGINITETEYPSVVKLITLVSDKQQSLCTGTFINATQVVTAGHCIKYLSQGKEMVVAALQPDGKHVRAGTATSFKVHPEYARIAPKFNKVSIYDLAVVTFTPAEGRSTSDLRQVDPAVNEELTIVGYGNNENFRTGNDLDGSGSGTKRVGYNTIDRVGDGFIYFEGLPAATLRHAAGKWASSGSGDSGGPLFIDGQLAGVTSGGGLINSDRTATSLYVDLRSEISLDFLESAIN